MEEPKKLDFSFLNFPSGKSDQEIEEAEKKEQAVKKQEVFEKSGVSRKFFNVSLDNYKAVTDEEKTALKESKNMVERIRKGTNEVLMFYGKFGTGKTHLGCSIIREVGGYYTTSFKLIIEYESCNDFKSKQTKMQMLEKYSNEKLLVIDEIGRGIKENVEKEILSYIINQRYENELPTVLITNLDANDFFKFMGMAIKDRCQECCITVELTGNSKRPSLRVLPLKKDQN